MPYAEPIKENLRPIVVRPCIVLRDNDREGWQGWYSWELRLEGFPAPIMQSRTQHCGRQAARADATAAWEQLKATCHA